MRSLLLTLLLSAFPILAHAQPATPADPAQPPSLLGVWYGTYGSDSGAGVTELWLGVYWQLSKDGWTVRGHNRWEVHPGADPDLHGDDSLGRQAGQFDTFTGTVDRDGKTLRLTEDGRGATAVAALEAADVMAARFFDKGADQPAFEVRLTRIDTHYDPAGQAVLGLDVSHHSGEVDWNKVQAQGYRFVYLKSSEGVDNPDAMFDRHWAALRETTLARGAYHFYVTEDDPVAQARFFASRLADDPGTLPPAVDVELLGKNTQGDMSATLLVFLQTFEKETGIRPMIYTGADFWDRYYRPEFSDYPLWMAEYGVTMPKVPFGWKNWTFWQHAADRSIDGVEKTADVSLAHPDVDLDALLPTAR